MQTHNLKPFYSKKQVLEIRKQQQQQQEVRWKVKTLYDAFASENLDRSARVKWMENQWSSKTVREI